MQQLVAALFSLQEQELVLTESRILHEESEPDLLQDIQRQVEDLRAAILPEYLKKYDTLRRNGAGVVSAADGVCHGCHLNVPQGDLNRMRRNQMPSICPNCARFLLLS